MFDNRDDETKNVNNEEIKDFNNENSIEETYTQHNTQENSFYSEPIKEEQDSFYSETIKKEIIEEEHPVEEEDVVNQHTPFAQESYSNFRQEFVRKEDIENIQTGTTEENNAKEDDVPVLQNDTNFSDLRIKNTEENIFENIKPLEATKDSYYKETIKNKNTKKFSLKKLVAACATIGLFGGLGIGASYSAMENLIFNGNQNSIDGTEYTNSETGTVTSNAQPISQISGGMDAVTVVDKVSSSVVNINTNVQGTQNYYGLAIPYEGTGSGSGVIFDVDEQHVYIVTNNHVIDGASSITVSITGEEQITATVIGTDATNDISVISALKADFEAAGVTNIVAATFGDSDNLKVGQSVIAIGNALGEGKSATGGMVSILNKTIEIDGLSLQVIQTSSPINPGNSGGALVDYNGNIVGINTAKTSSSVAEAMGYAIPSNTVKEIMEQLLTEGTSPKPYLGIMGSDITDDIADMYKLPVGVLVRQVFEGGSAQIAGLKEGDIIVTFAGKNIMDMETLIATLKEQEIGSTVEMDIIRDTNNSMTLKVEILDANNLS